MEPDTQTCYGTLEYDEKYEGTCGGGEQVFNTNSSAQFLPGGTITPVDINGFTCILSADKKTLTCTPSENCGDPQPCGTCGGVYYWKADISAPTTSTTTLRERWYNVTSAGVISLSVSSEVVPGPPSAFIVNARFRYNGSGPNGPAVLTQTVSWVATLGGAGAGLTWPGDWTSAVTQSIQRVDASGSTTAVPCPGESGEPCNPSAPSDPYITLRYTGCFPPPEPSDAAPQPDPGPPPEEPQGGIVTDLGASEGGSGGGGGTPNTRTITNSWPVTPATTGFQISPTTDEPFWPVYGSTQDDPLWYLYLPPLFTVREGVAPTLSPWNGVAFYANAPADSTIETGVMYRAVWAAPSIHLNDLASNKRVSSLATIFDNRQTRDIWTELNNTDEFTWGTLKHTPSANITVVREDVEGETYFDLYDYDTIRYPYNHYNVPDRIVLSESFKGVGSRLQAVVWSNDENTWTLEGFQLAARTKGTRQKTDRRR